MRGVRGPRGPGFVYSGLALLGLVVLLTFTMTVSQPPPPTIAEFSPQAVEQIEDAPEEQTSDFGTGAEGLGEGEAAETPGETPPPVSEEGVEVPRVHRCVGDPPRQIEDPQSPPCVPFWEGDNEGVTYRGVTRDEIRVVVPLFDDAIHPPMQAFLNSRFEFYGRQLRLIDVESPGGTPEEERAAAIAADEEEPFATNAGLGGTFHYNLELARRGVLSSTTIFQGMTDEFAQRWRPYLWSYLMATDRQFANIGEWACKRLAGENAVHAGDSILQASERRFGVFMTRRYVDTPLTVEPLERELARCGAELEVAFEMTYEEQASPFTPEDAANAMLQMRQAGVTSVFCLCVHVHLGHALRAASAQNYYPEWMLSTYEDIDNSGAVRGFGADGRAQLENAFGTTFRPRHLVTENHPLTWALREAGSGYTPDTFEMLYLYPELLLLASGIQMAGPVLTPETFEQGLHRTTFPNPDHPNMMGHVGFQDRDYTMTIDGAEIWWSNSAQGHDNLPAAWCYIEGGARHLKGQWPEGGDPFFEDPCDSRR